MGYLPYKIWLLKCSQYGKDYSNGWAWKNTVPTAVFSVFHTFLTFPENFQQKRNDFWVLKLAQPWVGISS